MNSDLLPSRISDAVRLCDNTSFPKFVGFLRSEETLVAEKTAENIGCKYTFFGGYESAERVFFGAFPEWCDTPLDYFPIKALTFSYLKFNNFFFQKGMYQPLQRYCHT